MVPRDDPPPYIDPPSSPPSIIADTNASQIGSSQGLLPSLRGQAGRGGDR